jgi:hypothetical protein
VGALRGALVGVRSTPTAVIYDSANTSRRQRQRGLYSRSRTSRQAASGGPIERPLPSQRIATPTSPFAFVSSFLL